MKKRFALARYWRNSRPWVRVDLTLKKDFVMLRKLRPRSVYDVLAALGFFLALGGSAYAVAANSVGTAQLKNGAVTNPKLARESVGSGKGIDGSLEWSDLGGSLRTNLAGSCPSGSRGAPMDPLGVGRTLCMDHFARGPAQWGDALDNCANSGLRLATTTEVWMAMRADRLNPGTAYWTDFLWQNPANNNLWGRTVTAAGDLSFFETENINSEKAKHYYVCTWFPLHASGG
jgi:hypothetical protein